ncbi:hypothetical protein AVEN_195183-1 [Araneus ventricosus]|uniref:Uncharacterized protein n=1 Tax=Araneus ventricosus TaxID=182803 RepID=A0A4Y2JFJ7_ARAVE|nr:hypothetical protein AVEN_195183-1 [Araneus ventricosus]
MVYKPSVMSDPKIEMHMPKKRNQRILNTSRVYTDLIRILPNQQQIKWYGGDDVDNEPTSQVVDGDFARMADYFVVGVDVSGTEVDEDVDDEHHVDDKVNNHDGTVIVQPLFVQQEGRYVGREDRCINDEQQDNPVPDRFEGGIVEDRPFVDSRFLEFVLG